MTIEIKEGRYYRDRMGQVHGPILRSSMTFWPWTTQDCRRTWTATGSVHGHTGGESMNDLIEEVRIVPVREMEGDA